MIPYPNRARILISSFKLADDTPAPRFSPVASRAAGDLGRDTGARLRLQWPTRLTMRSGVVQPRQFKMRDQPWDDGCQDWEARSGPQRGLPSDSPSTRAAVPVARADGIKRTRSSSTRVAPRSRRDHASVRAVQGEVRAPQRRRARGPRGTQSAGAAFGGGRARRIGAAAGACHSGARLRPSPLPRAPRRVRVAGRALQPKDGDDG